MTPRKNRQELRTHVNRPIFTKLEFSEDLQGVHLSSSLRTLKQLQLEIEENPESLLLEAAFQHKPAISPKSIEQSQKKRWVRTVKQYGRKAENIYKELGAWAADYFIQKTNELYFSNVNSSPRTISRADHVVKKLLMKFFDPPISKHTTASTLIDNPDIGSLSDKAAKLVEFIVTQSLETTGVIFVKERVIVSMLYQILSTYPQTAQRFKFATFVGLSNNVNKKAGIHELLDLESQKESLEAFRIREKHIIIATDVLEEGIDVAACNLVICFDPPQTLKSFIQRRGRARKKQSQFVIMQHPTSDMRIIGRWKQLEKEVRRLCEEENRTRDRIPSIEEQNETLNLKLHDESTQYGFSSVPLCKLCC